MRYYSVIISDPTTGKLLVPNSLAGVNTGASYTSLVNGKTIPEAQNIELDIAVGAFATPIAEAAPWVRIWGVSLQEIAQGSDLNGMAVQVFGGMQKGLPLANPKQAGLLTEGYIFQAFGNWIGTDMTLDLILTAAPTTVAPPTLIFNWKKGTPLSQAISQTLSAAFPGYKQQISISPNLVLPADEPGVYFNLLSFAQAIKSISAAIIGGDYEGVDILLKQKTFYVYDGTTQKSPVQIAFQDMIGQPTWIDAATVQVSFVMRADLSVGDYIQFPLGRSASGALVSPPVTSSSQTVQPSVNERLTFQGVFQIKSMHHVGNFRQSDAASWVTVVEASATTVVAA